MRLKVKVDNQIFDVEIENLRARPIIAFVDGEPFEIWPEVQTNLARAAIVPAPVQGRTQPERAEAISAPPAADPAQPPAEKTAQATGSASLKQVRAPIPGVITTVNVQAGDNVAVGQQLCMLEAMKMNNSIRASRAGRVDTVHITVGQHVKHHDVLLEFAD